MQDLTLVQLKQAYDAALEQIAAESFLEKGMEPGDIIDRLELGNNTLTSDPNAAELPGKLPMTPEQAEAFASRYRIIDAYPDDATGFSAVALRDTKGDADPTNDQVIIVVRSTEFNLDRPRDVATDLQIENAGFAFDQILALQAFKDLVLSQNPEITSFSLVGYSLSGNVVRTLAAMYPDEVNQAAGSNIVFNATGMGNFIDPTGQNRPRDVVLREMMTLYRTVEEDPTSADQSTIAANVNLQALYDDALNAPPLDLGDPDGNIYTNARVAFAETYISTKYQTGYSGFGTTASEPAFAQYFGHALSGFDGEAVANSGVHPDPTAIPIEGQPLIEVTTPRFDFLNTHSLTLVTDSLRLLILFKEVAPSVTMDDLQAILKASSAESAGIANSVESDTLEKALDALRKVFLPEDPNFQSTPSHQEPGGFGNFDERTVFYTNITAVENALPAQRDFSVQSLAGAPAAGLLLNAKGNDSIGLAYRFALKELNPFAVIGFDYAQHNVDGALEVLKPDFATGQLTTQYLEDRADFLAKKLEANTANGGVLVGLTNFFNDTHFMDVRTKDEIQAGLFSAITGQREFLFDDDSGHSLTGGSKDDHLYGAGGDDILTGNGGNDYLEGDAGNDTLEGGAGVDTYVYRINDNLDTITDSDGQGKILYDTHLVDGGIHRTTDAPNTYKGGAQGAMTYVLDGTNLVINNLITVQNFQKGQLGIHLTTAPDTQIPTLQPPSPPSIDFISNTLQERTAYYDLIVTLGNPGEFYGYAHKLTLPTGGSDVYSYEFGPLGSSAFSSVPFQQGEFGGGENGGDPQNGHGYYGYTFWQDNYGFIAADHMFGPDNLPWTPTGDASLNLHLLGGNDIVGGGPGNDQLYGDAGNDTLAGSGGNDRLFGGADDDTLYGDDGDDLLDGGDGNDRLIGGAGNNVLYGGVGNDTESVAGTGNNYLDGGTGNDTLSGSAGNDTLLGGDGADQLYAAEGNDYLDGGIGNDTLFGGAGNDTLLGGEDADHLDAGGGDNLLDGGGGADVLTVTGMGNNTLLGSAGEDQLSGSGGNDVLDGGAGNDTLTGGAGTNVILFGRDSDQDTVDDAGNAQAIDIIQFAGDVAPENVTVRAGDNLGLVLSILGTTDRITLPGFFAASFSPVIQASFADGTVWGPATLTAMAQNVTGDDAGNSLSGTILNDRIAGGIRADTLNGGAGTDTLIGGGGNDIYMFNLGDGVDTIQDTAIPGQGNVLSFGAGIGLSDLRLTQDAAQHTLTIQYDTDGDSVQLLNFDPNGVNGSLVVQTLSFADGLQVGLSDLLTVTMGTDGNDVITTGPEDNGIFAKGGDDLVDAGAGDDFVSGGAGNDTLNGGLGDDVLAGGEGDDTYVLHIGDGVDTIFDTWTTFGFGDNRILFGDGITPADLTLIQESNTLTITYGADGDAVQLANFDSRLVNGSLVVSALQFADGSQVALGEVAGFLFPGEPMGLPHTFTGMEGADVIAGTAGNDVIDARNGDDVVYADAGMDLVMGQGGDDLLNGGDDGDALLGGAGNDTLLGGAGNDVLTGDDVIPFGPPEIGPPDPGGGPPGLGEPPDPGGGLPGPEEPGGPPAGGRNDLLIGGAGDDLYTFNIGDGVDTIQDAALPGEGNHILFGMGIAVTDLTLSQDPFAGTLTINYDSVGDAIVLDNFAPDIEGGLVVRTVQFFDGTTLNTADLLAVNQVISGTADSAELHGTSGNDLLDAHLLNAYGGFVTVSAGAGNDIVLGGSNDDSLFGEEGNDTLIGGIGRDMLSGGDGNDTLYIDVNDMSVDGGAGYDTVVVQSGFWGTLNLGLASVEAAYGSNDDDILTTDGPDAITVSGNGGADLLVGGGGNDYLDGGDGNDTLKGSSGNDTLIGGAGNDIYTFNLGDGVDTVQDKSFPGEGNRIVFGNRITSANVTFTQDQTAHTLTLAYGSGGDVVQLSGFDPDRVNGSLVVGVVQFANGSTVNLADLFSPPVVISGTEGADVLSGSPGNDTLVGGTGNDTLIGGAGSDTYVFNAGDGVDTIVDTATASAGNTVIFGPGITPDLLSLGLGSLLLHYGDQGDAIHITNFDPNDALAAHAIDTFQFAGGTVLSYSDLIGRGFDLTGTEENDAITGTNAVDRIRGLAGNDVIQSGDGNDMVVGGSGNDSLDGGLGADAMAGGLGDDTYVVDSLGDTVAESPNAGMDVVQSTVSVTLPDNVENLVLTGGDAISGTGNALDNVLTGNNGANLLDGGPGADTMRGGLGDDTYIVDNVGDAVIEAAGEGVDMVQSSIGYTVGDNAENLMLTGSDAINGTGNALNNILLGNSAANVLDGGAGADTLVGGAGDDSYVVDNVGDVVIEVAGEGVDTVQSSLGYTLGANVENLTLTGSEALTGTGNTLDNVITGNGVANVLDGGAGADTLVGRAGDDSYVVDDGGDVVVEAPNEGMDAVQSAESFVLPDNVENLTLTGTAAITGTGNELDNVIIGNGVANVLDGGAGADMLVGGTGGDTYVVDNAGDVVVEAANEGVDSAMSTVNYTLSANVENLTLMGSDAITGTGNDLDNVLTGNSESNLLAGDAGNDTLTGGTGNDTLNGGTGNDTYIYNLGDGLDQVADPAGVDTVSFGAGISFDNTVARLTTAAGITTAHLCLLDAGGSELPDEGMDFALDAGGVSPIERFAFANGTTFALSDLVIQTKATQGTNGSDVVRTGRHDDVIEAGNGDDRVYAGTGHDTVYAGNGKDSLYGEGGSDALYGATGEDFLDGGGGNDLLDGGNGKDTLQGGAGDDLLDTGEGEDTIWIGRGDGRDTLNGRADNQGDTIRFGAGIAIEHLWFQRGGNDLTVSVLGASGPADQINIADWYTDKQNHVKEFETADGHELDGKRVDQLIQAMAQFSAESGLSWDQAIDQRPQDVQTILAASWQ